MENLDLKIWDKLSHFNLKIVKLFSYKGEINVPHGTTFVAGYKRQEHISGLGKNLRIFIFDI